jgi:enamine deaminase RidA (YjgF/YER057c/UK114 family)
MKRQSVNPQELYDPRFFSHAVAADGAARMVHVSGQVSYDRDGYVVGKDDFRAQCEQVFKSLSHALRACGARWADVVKMNAYMVGMTPDAVNLYREVRSRHVDAKSQPASTLVGVARLVHEDLLLEVELVAAVGSADRAKKRSGSRASKPAASKRAARKPARKNKSR